MSAETSWQIFHVTKSCCSPHIFITSVPNATCRSRQWCHITRIELPNYVVTMQRFHWGRDIDCLLSPPYHSSCMSDQLLMWHNAAYSVHYAQRQASASLWNARAYSRRSTYIKMYTNITLLLTWRLLSWHEWRWLHGKRSPPQFVTNCSMRKPPGERSTSSRCLPSWLSPDLKKKYANSDILTMKMIESYNNCTFST